MAPMFIICTKKVVGEVITLTHDLHELLSTSINRQSKMWEAYLRHLSSCDESGKLELDLDKWKNNKRKTQN